MDRTIELKAVAGLKYDKVRLVIKPGTTVRIELENADEMLHNMLIVEPGSRERVVEQAEAMDEQGMEMDYIPQSSNVIGSIPLLEAGEKASLVFKAPNEEGIYPYVCTYPAHGIVMYGAIYVTNDPDSLPRIDEDPNIPEPVRNQMAASNSMHPYPMEMPTVTRLFMPDASPAAIAVGMEKNQSYAWDAGFSHLRYVWSGGYIDASKQWDAKAQEVAELVGEVYYRNTAGFPFRVARKDSVPTPDFKGYSLNEEGYPQFEYKMGSIVVRELIVPADTSPGFQIQYQLDNVQQPIWYKMSDNNNVTVTVSKGKVEEEMISLTPEQAKQFIINISANK
ncbi:plastocyanin/azurin family copper-binding protein [Fodinibius salsisoli]|uniref:Blue (type 1) copper domain-containing protein n=1 Tax=Fodinibius salsisoli TaxID=2820877 RepID=A0ABT3PKC1_9BACT|nr:plastocyanin/azurin family copper-binding protein [Fodinibius salsisoli]MCW9706367.1 hypothetical protein [Fodinibius salsisoli]